MNPEVKELYAQKGMYQTQLEIAQSNLRAVNEKIIKILSQNGTNGKPEDSDNKTDSDNA